MKALLAFGRRLERRVLELIRTWWRPISCLSLAAAAVVNLVALPIIRREIPNLAEAAAFVAALTAAFGVRAFEKWKGLT